MIRTFDGAEAIVTGAASGIGRELALELARRGAAVTLADLQAEAAEEVADAIRARGGHAAARSLDVTDADAVRDLVEETTSDAGRLDYMFNNAGILIAGEVKHHAIDDWDRVIDVNIRGVAHGVQAAYDVMRAQGFGHIVNTASAFGLFPAPGTTSYAATKHAVVGLSRSLRAEAAPEGVRVTAVCPGGMNTPFISGGAFGRVVTPVGADPAARGAAMQAFAERRSWLLRDPEWLVPRVLDQVAKNRALVVLPFSWKVMWYLDRAAPSLTLAVLERANARMTRDLMQTVEPAR